jgi:hypothetical protein
MNACGVKWVLASNMIELRFSGFVESTVNTAAGKRFCKRQLMRWSKQGAHLMLQTRPRTLTRYGAQEIPAMVSGYEIRRRSENGSMIGPRFRVLPANNHFLILIKVRVEVYN